MFGTSYVNLMSVHRTIGVLSRHQSSPKNRPKRCKQDKSPNLILSVLTYWEEGWSTPIFPQQTTMALHFWGALFIQSQLQSTPGNREDNPMPNNVAEELSSTLPFQIGSVPVTQLGLKYDNCISHYWAAEIVLGELLKVGGCVICCTDLCLHSRNKHHDYGTASCKRQGGVINKHARLDILEQCGTRERLILSKDKT